MQCDNCGSPMNDNQKFCTNCGEVNKGFKEAENTAQASESVVEAENTVQASESVVEAENTAQAVESAAEAESGIQTQAAETGAADGNASENGGMNSANEENTVPVQAASAPEKTAAANDNSWSGTGSGDMYGSDPNKKKGGVLKFIGIGAAAVILLVAAFVGLNYKKMENQIKRTFSSPEEYYRYVEEKEIKKTGKAFADTYDVWLEQVNKNLENASAEGSMKLEIGEKPKEMYSQMLGVYGESPDLSWLKTVTFNTKAAISEGMYSASVEMLLNDKHLLEYIAHVSGDKVQLLVPDISDATLTVDTEKLGMGQQAMPDVVGFYKNLPEGKKIEPLINKYWLKMLGSVSDVKKSKEKLTVGEISQDTYKLEGRIDKEKLKTSLKAVIEEARQDEELKSVMTSVYQSFINMYGTQYITMMNMPEDPEAMYQKFLDSLDEEAKRLENDDMEDAGDSTLTLWVDKSGAVVGRGMSIERDGEESSFSFKLPRSGKKIGVEYKTESSSEYSQDILISGFGELDGSNMTGSFDVSADDTLLAVVDITRMDVKAFEKGAMDFAAEVSFKSLGDDTMSGSLPVDIEAFKLSMEITGDSKDAVTKMALTYDGENFVSLTSDSKAVESVDILQPTGNEVDMTSEAKLMEWVQTADWNKFIGNLRGTDIPSEWVDGLEMSLQFITMGY